MDRCDAFAVGILSTAQAPNLHIAPVSRKLELDKYRHIIPVIQLITWWPEADWCNMQAGTVFMR